MASCCPAPSVLFWALVLFLVTASPAEAVCVEVDSIDQVVMNNTVKLTCISCRKRQEMQALVDVTWAFQPDDGNVTAFDILVMIKNGQSTEFPSVQFTRDRLELANSKDYQEVSIRINQTTLNDTGTYYCRINRELQMPDVISPPKFNVTKKIHLTVLTETPLDVTAKVSEVMMYFTIVASTLLLIITLITCYKQVKQADIDKRNKVTDLLVIAPVNKENCSGEPAEEELKSSS